MRCLIVAVLLFAVAGCGGDGGATEEVSPPSVNSTGTWVGFIPGVYQANGLETPSTSVTIVFAQSGASISGKYYTSTGALGDIAGTISGSTVDVAITLTKQSCSGLLTGTGAINKPANGNSTMDFHVSGFSTCGGNESDIAYLRQISVPALSNP